MLFGATLGTRRGRGNLLGAHILPSLGGNRSGRERRNGKKGVVAAAVLAGYAAARQILCVEERLHRAIELLENDSAAPFPILALEQHDEVIAPT